MNTLICLSNFLIPLLKHPLQESIEPTYVSHAIKGSFWHNDNEFIALLKKKELGSLLARMFSDANR